MNVYKQFGFDTREEYLDNLAESYDIPEEIVHELAFLLGENEDFDGLITTLEDDYYGKCL